MNTTPILGGRQSLGSRVTSLLIRRASAPDLGHLVSRFGTPQRGLSPWVNDWRADNSARLGRSLKRLQGIQKYQVPVLLSALYCTLIPAGESPIFFGLSSLEVVTTAGVNFLQTCFLGTAEPEIIKFHALGTGSTAEAIGDTLLVTEWTSAEYAARATGSLTTGASANVFRTIGTNTKLNAGTSNVTEHGLFTSATIGAVTLWDRSLTGTFALSQNDALQTQYDLTLSAGG